MEGTTRVLVVDEDEDVLELTATFLERESDAIDVVAEHRAETALEHVRTEDVDCVVSDYRMPEMSGLELFEDVREHDEDVPFFLFTAAVDSGIAERAESAGVTAFVEKGVGTDHYADLAEDILAAVGDQ